MWSELRKKWLQAAAVTVMPGMWGKAAVGKGFVLLLGTGENSEWSGEASGPFASRREGTDADRRRKSPPSPKSRNRRHATAKKSFAHLFLARVTPGTAGDKNDSESPFASQSAQKRRMPPARFRTLPHASFRTLPHACARLWFYAASWDFLLGGGCLARRGLGPQIVIADMFRMTFELFSVVHGI